MGFFDKMLGGAGSSTPEPIQRVISFDSNWFDSWESLRIEQETAPFPVSVKVAFDTELLKEIWNSIEQHAPIGRVAYDEEQQHINNVGESFVQDGIAAFCDGEPGDDLGWLAGFLLPEMANGYDKTAVAIYVLRISETGIDSENPFRIVQGGYMDKDSAKKVHKKILNLMGKNLFIPLLITIHGGTREKANYGVFAYAKTKAIQFP